MNPKPAEKIGLKRFAVFTALMTFVLVWMGGLVTSKGVGLSVPDWPNSYGYNMFFFPVSKWMGGIFYEHTHRLAASTVGFLTLVLAHWLFGYKSRPALRWGGGLFILTGTGLMPKFPTYGIESISVGVLALFVSFFWPKCAPAPKWLRVLGIVALIAVIAQGVLGGLRVTLLAAALGIFHATLAQLFFLLVSAIALFQMDFWRRLPVHTEADRHHLRLFFLLPTCLIFAQLAVGATMRHQHAGLSIPDFPAAYGQWWPDTSPAAVQRYNENRMEAVSYNPITAFQIDLQMAHRLMALVIFVAVGVCAGRAGHFLGFRHPLTRLACLWLGLILTQVFLGAATIWTGKSADVATAHVACGALCLVTGGLSSIVSFRMLGSPVAQGVAEKKELTSLLPSSSITGGL
ncbi:MAG TPA: COX15/CtaA family protein [Candidatus Saccharimonadales bacterium]|nr:COX15/CtaA family protein [Candidatus Saccharimonadales bacterium]